MSSLTQVLKSEGTKLVPFLKTVAIYFVLFIPVEKPSVWAMFVKCAPILSLMFFVCLHGVGFKEEYTFSRRILLGLIFSCVGDALLVWPQYFLHGMCFFGIAQVWYIMAFGFKNKNFTLAMPLYSLALYVVTILLGRATGEFVVGLPVYGALLMTMVWRATARVRLPPNSCSWTDVSSCIGGISFAISDAVIGFDKFHATVPHSQLLIMSSYYLAQFAIALSVINSSSLYKLAQKNLLEKPLPEESSRKTTNAKSDNVKQRTSPKKTDKKVN